jgi:sigma-E factor negative regulatory protein RseC
MGEKAMKQTGVVIGIEGDKAKIKMQRHTACGDCGACQVSSNQLNVTLEAQNPVGAAAGDFVEVDMETMDFLSAVILVYLLPLVALVAGIFAGYYGVLLAGVSDRTAQGIGGVVGILAAALSYLFIKTKEEKLKSTKKYKPIISGIVEKE